jgi:hypothetical protein
VSLRNQRLNHLLLFFDHAPQFGELLALPLEDVL